jgi:hypothetical protein
MRLVDTSAWIEWLIASPAGKSVEIVTPRERVGRNKRSALRRVTSSTRVEVALCCDIARQSAGNSSARTAAIIRHGGNDCLTRTLEQRGGGAGAMRCAYCALRSFGGLPSVTFISKTGA